MTKTRTTKKPAAKPQRKPRKPAPTVFTEESIRKTIGDVLGRKLGDLLAGSEVTSAGVHACTVDKAADQYVSTHTNLTPSKQTISPVETAINNLRSAVTHAEVITESETERLDSVLAPSPVKPDSGSNATGGPPSLANALHAIAERIHADNYRRNELLDRLEL